MPSTETSSSLTKQDLSRRYFLEVAKSGHVFIRERGAPAADGLLPVFSVDTHAEAEALRVRNCKLARDGSGTYRLNDWPEDGQLKDLYRAADLFRAQYGNTRAGLNAFTGEPKRVRR